MPPKKPAFFRRDDFLFILFFLIFLPAILAYHVGYFNDDAFFLIGAQSLLQGRFVVLSQPGTPPLVNYFPGTSFLLLPVALFSPSTAVPYQLVFVLLMAGAMVMFKKFIEKESSTLLMGCVLLLTVFNPLILSSAGTVLSDIPYFFCSLLFFVVLNLEKKNFETKKLLWLALVAAVAFYFRPVGLCLILAEVGVLLKQKKWRDARMFAAISGILILPLFLRNYAAAAQWPYYLNEFFRRITSSSYSWPEQARWYGRSIIFYGREAFIREFFRWPGWESSTIINGPIALVLMIAMWRGLSIKNKAHTNSVFKIYLLIYVLMLIVWKNLSDRYLLPVLPFIIFYVLKGIERLWVRQQKAVLVGFSAVVLAWTLPTAVKIYRCSLDPEINSLKPAYQTYNWLKMRTKESDIFATELDGTFYLFTGRQTFALPYQYTRAGIESWLQQRNVKYILTVPTDQILKSHEERAGLVKPSTHVLEEILAEGKLFKLFYINHEERTVVYQRVEIRSLPKKG